MKSNSRHQQSLLQLVSNAQPHAYHWRLVQAPISDVKYMFELWDTINKLYLGYPTASIWISGDANLPDIEWSTRTITLNQYSQAISQHFHDMLGDIGSEQTVDFTTKGENIHDLFITNQPSLVTRQHPIPGVSDHEIVFSEVQTHVPRKRPIKRKVLLWNM